MGRELLGRKEKDVRLKPLGSVYSRLEKREGEAKQRKKRSTRAEIEARVGVIADMLLAGALTTKIEKFAREQWGVCSRQAYYYIDQARKRIMRTAYLERDYHIAQAIERYMMLYQRAFVSEDIRTCLMIQMRVDKLLGLEARAEDAQRVEIAVRYVDRWSDHEAGDD